MVAAFTKYSAVSNLSVWSMYKFKCELGEMEQLGVYPRTVQHVPCSKMFCVNIHKDFVYQYQFMSMPHLLIFQ